MKPKSPAGNADGNGVEPAGSGVLPHERTLSGPWEDRYKLLRATGVNTSPVIVLFDDPSGETGVRLAKAASGAPDIDVTDDDGVRHSGQLG